MLPSKDLPQLYGKLTVQGKDSQKLISFIRSLGKSSILSDDTAKVVICTEKCGVSNCDDYAVAIPYYKGFDKTKTNCEQILTYAIDDNGADVVAKNIRKSFCKNFCLFFESVLFVERDSYDLCSRG